jgi:hypothetical protein
MATDLQTSSAEHTSLTGLVTGIVNDAQELLQQQLALFRSELRQDLRKSREMASSLVVGAIVGLVAVVLLGFMLVYLLAYLTTWHLAGCFAIVGGLAAVVAGVLIYTALRKLQDLNPLGQTTEAIQENLEWKTNATTQR